MTKNSHHFNGAVKKAIVLSIASRQLVGVICEPGGYVAITPGHVPNSASPERFGQFFADVHREAGEGVQFVAANGGAWVGLAVRRRADTWRYEFRSSGVTPLQLAAAAATLTAAEREAA